MIFWRPDLLFPATQPVDTLAIDPLPSEREGGTCNITKAMDYDSSSPLRLGEGLGEGFYDD